MVYTVSVVVLQRCGWDGLVRTWMFGVGRWTLLWAVSWTGRYYHNRQRDLAFAWWVLFGRRSGSVSVRDTGDGPTYRRVCAVPVAVAHHNMQRITLVSIAIAYGEPF